MKRLVISMSILLAVFFVLSQVFAAAENEDSKRTEEVRAPKYSTMRPRRPRPDANSLTAELKFLADANAIKGRIKEFEGLDKALADVTKGSQEETREWTHEAVADRVNLAKAVQKQAIAEFVFIRKLAVEEGAQKTVAAIDGLLLGRQERFVEVLGKMLDRTDAQKREWMRMRRAERYRRGRGRNERTRYRDREREEDTYQDDNTYRSRYRDREEIRR